MVGFLGSLDDLLQLRDDVTVQVGEQHPIDVQRILAGEPGGGRETAMAAKFEIIKDKRGEYRFHLKAANGEIIATSEGYKTKASAKNGIESVQKNAPDATVVDLTE